MFDINLGFCRVELCSKQGQTLKAFSLTECHGGPHEFRGVRRAELLKGLRDALPPEILHFGCPLADVVPDVNGELVALSTAASVPHNVYDLTTYMTWWYESHTWSGIANEFKESFMLECISKQAALLQAMAF